MSNTIQASSPTSAIVTQTNKKTFIVDLTLARCSCGHFQSNGIPCGHAFSFICYLQSCFSNHSNPGDYIPTCFTSVAWQKTYVSNISPVSVTGLTLSTTSDDQSMEVLAPAKERKAQGRPKIKRFIRGEQRKTRKAQAHLNNLSTAPEKGQGSQACRNCGDYGHNRRSCKEDKLI